MKGKVLFVFLLFIVIISFVFLDCRNKIKNILEKYEKMTKIFFKSEKGKLVLQHCRNKEIIIYFFKKNHKIIGLIYNFKDENKGSILTQRHLFFHKISTNPSYFTKKEYKKNVSRQRNIIFEFGWNKKKFISLEIDKEINSLFRNILKFICKNNQLLEFIELYTNIQKFIEKINENSICNLYIEYNSNELFIYEFIFDLHISKLNTSSQFTVNLDKISNIRVIDYLLLMIYGVTDDNNLSQNLISRANKRFSQ